MIMKLQTILMSLVLIVVTLASALVSYSSVAVKSRRDSPASSLCPSAMRSEGIELASMGFQVGNM
jgi:Tfp pilus assembly protein PilE